MPLNMEYNEKHGMIVIESIGDIDVNELIDIRDRVVSTNSEHRSDRILADIRKQTNHINIIKIWEYGSTLWDVMSNKTRIAIVHGGQKEEVLSFFITVAKNRGFSIDGFTTREAAVEWLTR